LWTYVFGILRNEETGCGSRPTHLFSVL
jgi:hypothetical protein